MENEILNKVTDLAALQFSLEEIGIMLDLEPSDIRDQAFVTAWARGSLLAQVEVRRELRRAATDDASGSGRMTIKSQAQREFLRLGERNAKLIEIDYL